MLALLTSALALPTNGPTRELEPAVKASEAATVKASDATGRWLSLRHGHVTGDATCPYNVENRFKRTCSSERFALTKADGGYGALESGAVVKMTGDFHGPKWIKCSDDVSRCGTDGNPALATSFTITKAGGGSITSGDVVYMQVGDNYLDCRQGDGNECGSSKVKQAITIFGTSYEGAPIWSGEPVYLRSGQPPVVATRPGEWVQSGVKVFLLGGTHGLDRWVSCADPGRCYSNSVCPFDEAGRADGKCVGEMFQLVKLDASDPNINNGDAVYIAFGDQWLSCCADSCTPGAARSSFVVYNAANNGPITTGGNVYFKDADRQWLSCYWGHCETNAGCPDNVDNRAGTDYCQGERFTMVLAAPPDTGSSN